MWMVLCWFIIIIIVVVVVVVVVVVIKQCGSQNFTYNLLITIFE